MEQAISIFHVLAALAIIGLIMLQQGKGADMGASFGGGGSQTLFGSTGGGSVLTKSTAWFVTLFFITSFGLAVIAKNRANVDVASDLSIPAVVETVVEPAAVSDIPEAEVVTEKADELDIPAAVAEPAASVEGDIPVAQ
jgi:preprotein translocase subunit SecG